MRSFTGLQMCILDQPDIAEIYYFLGDVERQSVNVVR